ncbi:uncharacterized protein METZ01_LOCUS356267, partial [marine metagenome]
MQRKGCEFQIERIAVRDLGKARAAQISDGVIGTDPDAVIADDRVQVVVEL